MSARPLGLFAALALSPSAAWAADPTVQLTYEPTRTSAGWDVKIYAVNTGKAVVMVDDNPVVEKALVETSAGQTVALAAPPNYEMISRAGPVRKWMAVQPGERLLVGVSTVGVPVETTIQDGTMVLTVQLVTKDGYAERVDRVPLRKPDS